LIKGKLNNFQKKIQHINGSTITDCLDNSSCGKHCTLSIFVIRGILIKHYGIVGAVLFKITLRRFKNFWRQRQIHKLCY